MALVSHLITALERSNDPNVNTLNTVSGAGVSLFDSQGQAVLLYDDELGTNPSTTKTTDASGQVVVWVTAGEYDEAVNGSTLRRVSVGGVSVVSYATTNDMLSSRPTKTGLRAENLQVGGQYELAASGYTAISGDKVAANGRVWKLIGGSIQENLVVNMPSDFADAQSAINFYHNKILFDNGFELQLNYESGHQPEAGISVSNGDYSYIRVTSADATVTVAPTWFGGGFLFCGNGRPPILDTVIDLNGLATSSAYYLNNSSVGEIAPGGGCINGANRGAHISNGSTLAADDCIFTGFGQAGIHSSRASTVQCANANLSGNSQDPTNTFGALYASRSSRIHGPNINLTSSGGDGVRVQRLGTIVVPDIDVSGCAGIAFVANGGDIMSDSGNPVTANLQGQLINAGNNGRIYLGEVNATFAAGMTDFAIECRFATIYVRDLTMSGHEGIGIYAIGAGAKVDCPTYTVTSGQDGINCLDLAEMNIERCNITGQARYGVNAASGAKVTIEDGTVSGSAINDLNCVKGAQVIAINATTTSGAVNVADTNFSAFNTIEGNKGIIWA